MSSSTLPAEAFSKEQISPDPRHAAALDAVGRPLHPLRCRARASRPIFDAKTRRTSPLWSANPLNAPMKPTPTSPPELGPLLAFGAHPDDIEFGCGGRQSRGETRAGRPAHLVVCSRGEAGSHGTPDAAAGRGPKGGRHPGRDHRIPRTRRRRPSGSARGTRAETGRAFGGASGLVLAPSLVGNQHPDHARLGHLVRDAARLARYGGVRELRRACRRMPIGHLFYYAVTPEAEPPRYFAAPHGRFGAGDFRRLDRRHGSARVPDRRPQLCRAAADARPAARLARGHRSCHRPVPQRPAWSSPRWRKRARGARRF